ncbi:MAG TPA: hypothetical protein VF590_12610 [Isosphaeraceae bacterium]|jgi:nitric oxide reductase activation protein
MNHVAERADGPLREAVPAELLELRERVRALPPELRTDLEPIVAEALEHARFRDRILTVARDALERLRLDLEMARFDLDATRREREDLRRLIEESA